MCTIPIILYYLVMNTHVHIPTISMKTVVPDEEKEFYVRALNVLQRQNDIVYDQRLDTYNVDSGDIRSMRCRVRLASVPRNYVV
jgi:hypothetical protein